MASPKPPARKYFDPTEPPFFHTPGISEHFPRSEFCEHCGEAPGKLRHDTRRGDICRHCDSALDEMEAEEQDAPE